LCHYSKSIADTVGSNTNTAILTTLLIIIVSIVYFVVILDSENGSTLQSKLKLPAPSATVAKPHTDMPSTITAIDHGDNTHSSLLAGMFLAYFITVFHNLYILCSSMLGH